MNCGYLVHYGTPRHSGRYPWGSGDRPHQSLETSGNKIYGLRKIDDSAIARRPKTKEVLSRTKKDYAAIADAQKWEDRERKKIKGQEIVNSLKVMGFRLNRAFDKYNSYEIPIKRKEMTKDEDLKIINPSKKSSLIGPTNNCCLCTIAYDLRRRGYDVIAKQHAPIDLLYDVGAEDIASIYKGAKRKEFKNVTSMQKQMENEPNGSRGAAFCTWGGNSSGGHVTAYEIENGKPVLYDAQSGKKYNKIDELFKPVKKVSYMRLDNLKPNELRMKIAID